MTKKKHGERWILKGFVFVVFAVAFMFFIMSRYSPETLLKVFTDFLVWFLGLFFGLLKSFFNFA